METNLILSKVLFFAIAGLTIVSLFVLAMIILSLMILYREKRTEYFWHVVGWLFVFYLLQALKFIGENYYGSEI